MDDDIKHTNNRNMATHVDDDLLATWQGESRFELELELVQSLASGAYLNNLATNGHLQNANFISFLRYLRYWRRPEYAAFLSYPACLHMLELLQHEDFRDKCRDKNFTVRVSLHPVCCTYIYTEKERKKDIAQCDDADLWFRTDVLDFVWL